MLGGFLELDISGPSDHEINPGFHVLFEIAGQIFGMRHPRLMKEDFFQFPARQPRAVLHHRGGKSLEWIVPILHIHAIYRKEPEESHRGFHILAQMVLHEEAPIVANPQPGNIISGLNIVPKRAENSGGERLGGRFTKFHFDVLFASARLKPPAAAKTCFWLLVFPNHVLELRELLAPESIIQILSRNRRDRRPEGGRRRIDQPEIRRA